MRRLITCIALAALGTACSARALDVGRNSSPDAGNCSYSALPPFPAWPSPDACVVGNELTMIVGVWEGYFQGSQIGAEAATFRLNILGANATRGLCGTLTFGTHTAPITIPPATDPTVAYPPLTYYPQSHIAGPVGTILGLAQTILIGKVDGQRVTFEVSPYEIYKSWCALQTPYADLLNCGKYGCLPNEAGGQSSPGTCYEVDPATNQNHNVPCDQFFLCNSFRVCDCDASGCTATQNNPTQFDLIFSGNQATGIASGQNVILNRVTSADN